VGESANCGRSASPSARFLLALALGVAGARANAYLPDITSGATRMKMPRASSVKLAALPSSPIVNLTLCGPVVGFGNCTAHGTPHGRNVGALPGNEPVHIPSLALGAFFLKMEASFTPSAAFFALGSTFFSWLLLRGRMIPVALAWLGVLASILPVVCFPLQLVGFRGGPIASFMWYPVLLFEVALALWLIIKGVAALAPRQPA